MVGEQYGTRASTIIIVNRNGHCRFVERSYEASGQVSGEIRESFPIGAVG